MEPTPSKRLWRRTAGYCSVRPHPHVGQHLLWLASGSEMQFAGLLSWQDLRHTRVQCFGAR